ncbi:S8 family serine peptidase [Streptomyces sp. NPDC047197]|uniref:S8 family serine peptidase n=1 Tax=unclassified Streptomyces TaxID=2593676 RepID=UPI0033EBF815
MVRRVTPLVRRWRGTSAATAIASASAALLWSKRPNWTANQVLRVLIDTAGRDGPKDDPSVYLGWGPDLVTRGRVRRFAEAEGTAGPPSAWIFAGRTGRCSSIVWLRTTPRETNGRRRVPCISQPPSAPSPIPRCGTSDLTGSALPYASRRNP